jgi:hypothetical protein
MIDVFESVYLKSGAFLKGQTSNEWQKENTRLTPVTYSTLDNRGRGVRIKELARISKFVCSVLNQQDHGRILQELYACFDFIWEFLWILFFG